MLSLLYLKSKSFFLRPSAWASTAVHSACALRLAVEPVEDLVLLLLPLLNLLIMATDATDRCSAGCSWVSVLQTVFNYILKFFELSNFWLTYYYLLYYITVINNSIFLKKDVIDRQLTLCKFPDMISKKPIQLLYDFCIVVIHHQRLYLISFSCQLFQLCTSRFFWSCSILACRPFSVSLAALFCSFFTGALSTLTSEFGTFPTDTFSSACSSLTAFPFLVSTFNHSKQFNCSFQHMPLWTRNVTSNSFLRENNCYNLRPNPVPFTNKFPLSFQFGDALNADLFSNMHHPQCVSLTCWWVDWLSGRSPVSGWMSVEVHWL